MLSAEKSRKVFLELLSTGLSVTAAANATNKDRRHYYAWRRDIPEFREAWDAAIEAGSDLMEDEARRRAVEGYDRPVYQGGELVGYVREYSDGLLQFLLKARRPDKFRDRVQQIQTGADGGPIQTTSTNMNVNVSVEGGEVAPDQFEQIVRKVLAEI
jgi:hypothetical protein